MILGLSGYGGAGKDTVGEIICRRFHYERRAFADELKRFGAQLFGVDVSLFHDRAKKFEPLEGWDGVTPAEIGLKLGTEVGRHLHPDIWVRLALRGLPAGGRYVFTDLRFPNEFNAIRRLGGRCIRISRDGVHPRIDPQTGRPHISDIALDNGWMWQAEFDNNGTIADLETTVVDRLSKWAAVRDIPGRNGVPNVEGVCPYPGTRHG